MTTWHADPNRTTHVPSLRARRGPLVRRAHRRSALRGRAAACRVRRPRRGRRRRAHRHRGRRGRRRRVAPRHEPARHGCVLLYEGEELVGAKQNRVLERSILVAAGSKLEIPAKCVEQGRWGYRSPPVRARAACRASRAAPALARLGRPRRRTSGPRSTPSRRASQAVSPTGAAEEMYIARAASLDEYLQALPRLDGQAGAIVGIAGELVCLDYVSRSEVFAGLYLKLLRGYALSAIERPLDKPLRRRDLGRFLGELELAKRAAPPGRRPRRGGRADRVRGRRRSSSSRARSSRCRPIRGRRRLGRMSHDGDAADAALLARGEHARLLAKYEPVIVGRCVAELRGHVDADDVAQDVKVRLWGELRKGQDLLGAVSRRRPQGHRLDGQGLLRRPPDARGPAGGVGSGRPGRRPRRAARPRRGLVAPRRARGPDDAR